MSHERLRPEAERALRRAAAGGVERNVGMQQKRHVVILDVEIALVDFGDMRQRVEILNLRSVGIVHDFSILQKRNAGNLRQRLALGVIDHGVVEFLAANEINLRTIAQRFLRQHGHMRPNKSNLDLGIRLLDRSRQQNVAGKPGRRSKQHQELVVPRDLDGLLARHVMRRRIEQPRPLQHSRRISQPNGIPETFNFAGGGPTGAGASVEVFKGWGIQKQCF